MTAGRVVKGVKFQELRDAGDPVECAKAYDAQGADELVFLDITASSDGRKIMRDVVAATAEQCFMPLTVGGGLLTVEDIEAMLKAGADKVSLNSAAIADPTLINRCPARFGRQAVVVAIDAARESAPGDANEPGRWIAYARGGRDRTGLDAVAWARRAVDLGAGELLVTSIDRDGTGSGFDTDLLRAISAGVPVPVIASGGAAGPDDFVRAIRDGGADAVLAASIFHRRTYSIGAIKAAMAAAGLPVRLVEERAA